MLSQKCKIGYERAEAAEASKDSTIEARFSSHRGERLEII